MTDPIELLNLAPRDPIPRVARAVDCMVTVTPSSTASMFAPSPLPKSKSTELTPSKASRKRSPPSVSSTAAPSEEPFYTFRMMSPFKTPPGVVIGLIVALNATLRTQVELDLHGGSEFDAALKIALEAVRKELCIDPVGS